MHGSRSTRLTRFMASLSKAFGRPVQPTKQASSRVMSLSKSTASPRSPPASSRAKYTRTRKERIFCSWSGRKAMRAIEPFIPIRTNQRASGGEMRPSRIEAAASVLAKLSAGGKIDLDGYGQELLPPAAYSFVARSLRAFVMTDTELKLMAAAAIIGFSSNPMNGYRTPAANGTPSAL